MRDFLQRHTGWLPKFIKDFLTRIGHGEFVIEYCNRCGVEQPLVWWCNDTALWTRINGTEGGALCPQCFDRAASQQGVFLRWYPVDESARADPDRPATHEA